MARRLSSETGVIYQTARQPTGLALSIVAGKLRLSGTPSASGTFSFTVAVDTGDGQTATSAQNVVIA